jgi:hypothetical protein
MLSSSPAVKWMYAICFKSDLLEVGSAYQALLFLNGHPDLHIPVVFLGEPF